MSEDLVEKVDQLAINQIADVNSVSEGTIRTEQTNGQSIDVVVSRKFPTDSNSGYSPSVTQKLSKEVTPGLQSPRKRTLSPLRYSNRSQSPGKSVSIQRERTSTQSPERTFILSKSPDRSRIWSQWDLPDHKKECIQDYNIKQMEWLYGKPLGGQVEAALQWYREVWSLRSSNLIGWKLEAAVAS